MTKAIISFILFFALSACASAEDLNENGEESYGSPYDYDSDYGGDYNRDYDGWYSEDDGMAPVGGMLPIENLPDSFYGEEMSDTSNVNFSFAFPVDDMDGDSLRDLLMTNITTDPITGEIFSEISAIRGIDGEVIWEKEFPSATAYAYPLGDVDADNCTDIMIDVVTENLGSLPYSGVMAASGRNGTEIWSRFEILSLTTIAYPIDDINDDGGSDLIVHVVSLDMEEESIITTISTVDGATGEDIETREYPDALALQYPVGNMTNDTVKDHILGLYKFETDDPFGGQSVSSTITAIDPVNCSIIWEKRFSDCLVIVWPYGDITDDGIDDMLFYEISPEAETNETRITAVSGDGGMMIWRRGFGTYFPMALQGTDLTGDGIEEFIVYSVPLEETEDEGEIMTLDGKSGSLLWKMSEPTILLPWL